ncbi:MAG TPA: hypothetical protein VGC54_00985 [Planctomycetota bacterium]
MLLPLSFLRNDRRAQRGTSRVRREQGSILLPTLGITGFAATLSLTLLASVEVQLDIARNEVQSLHSELGGHSAVEYALRRITLDPAWSGTPVGGMEMAGGTSFTVARKNAGGSKSTLEIRGSNGLGGYAINVEVDVQTVGGTPGESGFLQHMAFVSFTGKGKLIDTEVIGDVLFGDAPTEMYAWDADTEEYQRIEVDHSVPVFKGIYGGVQGTVFNYDSENVYNTAREQKQIDQPIHMPRVDMDFYLEPSDRVVIFDGVTALSDVVLEKTAVFVLPPGQSLSLRNVQLRGGAVVWSEPDYDLFGEERGNVKLDGSSSIGGGDGGVSASMGQIAPAYKVRASNQSQVAFRGLQYWGRMDTSNRVTVVGQAFVNTAIMNWHNSTIVYDPAVANAPPPGIHYYGESEGEVFLSLDVLKVYEVFPNGDDLDWGVRDQDFVWAPGGSDANPGFDIDAVAPAPDQAVYLDSDLYASHLVDFTDQLTGNEAKKAANGKKKP